MSDGFIAKFLNSEIMSKGGTAEPLDVTIGKKNDIASSTNTSSIFSWIKNIWGVISTLDLRLTAARAGYLDYLANGTYGLSALNTKLTNLTTVGNIKTVKNVQRGVNSGSNGDRGITISSVTPEKCSVTIHPSAAITNKSIYLVSGVSGQVGSMDLHIPYVVSLTSTLLTVSRSSQVLNSNPYYSALPFSWEIVEFY